MGVEYNYTNEKGRLDQYQSWWGKQFEAQLCEFFERNGELVKREPELASGARPDFLIEDANSNRCYVEAKVRHNSFEENRYFDSWLFNTLLNYDAVDGKGVALEHVGGQPDDNPPIAELVSQISEWLSTVNHADLPEHPSKTFALDGITVKVVATPAHNPNNLLQWSSRSGDATVKTYENTWLSEKAYDAVKKYTPTLLSGLPLVLAVLNLSDRSITETDVYGHQYVEISKTTGAVTNGGYNGLGLWHGNAQKERLATLHGVWVWDHLGATPQERPTLYANLDIEGIVLPQSLHEFKHSTRGQVQGGTVQIERGDGGATYHPEILESSWEKFFSKRRREAAGEP